MLATRNATQTLCGAPIRNRTPIFDNVTIVLGVISGVVVAVRIGSKIAMRMDFAPDDWAIMVTLACGIPSSVMNVRGTGGNGEGKDIWTLPFDMITRFGIYFYVLEILYFVQVMMLKMTLLFFYLNIFPGSARKLLWATVVLNGIFGVTFILLAVFQCNPISHFWTGWDGEHAGSCLNSNAIGWANAATSIALDLWMIAIPLWQIRKLNLHWKKKVGVAVMLLVGTFVTVVSIVRLQFLVNLGSSANPTYDQIDVSIWSTVEINIGIICTCLPAIRLFLIRLFPRLGGSSHKTSGYQNYPDSYGKSENINSRAKTLVEAVKSQSRPEHRGIELKTMYEVRYSDEDETRLVKMQEGNAAKAVNAGGSSRSMNSASELSL
ncbi:pth11-typeg- -coupled receptor [Trichoderma arundinaceum]|uniref:Pth11-typeg--coupled receptor n=1 Tax=Trichoderma arundinaceum TaxID=490622 RepID=A0A395NSG6_TRIAR|nr:pth11-typeg- -coupled receptor [Trichoderma arundinaceum]